MYKVKKLWATIVIRPSAVDTPIIIHCRGAHYESWDHTADSDTGSVADDLIPLLNAQDCNLVDCMTVQPLNPGTEQAQLSWDGTLSIGKGAATEGGLAHIRRPVLGRFYVKVCPGEIAKDYLLCQVEDYDDQDTEDRCPGCGREPGGPVVNEQSLTPGCNHPEGCGFYRTNYPTEFQQPDRARIEAINEGPVDDGAVKYIQDCCKDSEEDVRDGTCWAQQGRKSQDIYIHELLVEYYQSKADTQQAQKPEYELMDDDTRYPWAGLNHKEPGHTPTMMWDMGVGDVVKLGTDDKVQSWVIIHVEPRDHDGSDYCAVYCRYHEGKAILRKLRTRFDEMLVCKDHQ